MAVQIQLRNGTAAQWTAANPTLAAGEVGTETDTSKLKIGNGSTAWNSLAYASGSGTVSSVSVVSANGLAGTVATATTTPAITLSTSITGVLKGNGTAISAAAAGTDYLAPPSGTAILKAASGGALANATAGTDYLAPPSGTAILKAASGGALANAVAGTDYQAPITLTTTGTSGAATFISNTLNIPQYSGGGGTPGGSNTQIQFNNSSAFGGSANLTWDGTNVQLGAAGALRFANTANSFYVAFKGPTGTAANVTWTLPSADGTSNQVLSTNGSGTLSWATASAGGPLLESYQTISQNYTITTGSNGLSAGPVAVATGYAVTIPTGQTWTVLA